MLNGIPLQLSGRNTVMQYCNFIIIKLDAKIILYIVFRYSLRSEEVEPVSVILLLVCNTFSVQLLPVPPFCIEGKRAQDYEGDEAIMPVRTNSPGEPVLSFPPNMLILLLRSSSRGTPIMVRESMDWVRKLTHPPTGTKPTTRLEHCLTQGNTSA